MGNTVSAVTSYGPFWTAQAVNLAVQTVGFSIAAPLQTEKFYDAFGALGFLSTVTYSFVATRSALLPNAPLLHSTRSIIATATTLLWTTRLGGFLLDRVINSEKGDSRFDKIKTEPFRFAVAWFMQAVWVGVTAAPVLLVNTLDTRAGTAAFRPGLSGLRPRDFVGLGLWAAGWTIEIVADRQKSKFNEKQKNAKEKRWIDEGLWKYSRHPNYFGEMLLWTGQFALCSSGLGAASRFQWGVALASPVLVSLLLTKVSGIPLLEKSADKKWGNIAEYQRYKQRTSVLVPWVPRNV